MQVPRLRPLRIGEILDVSIKIFLHNALTLIQIVAIALVPVLLVGTLVLLAFAPSSSGFATESEVDAYLGASAVVGIIQALAGFVAAAACFKAVAEAYLGQRPSAGASVTFAAKKLHSILWIALLSLLIIGIGAGIGAITGIIHPGVAVIVIIVWVVYMLVSLYFGQPALLAEDVRGIKAMERSRSLVKGRWWPTFGVLAVAFIFMILVQAILGAVFGPLVAYEPGDSITAVIVWNQVVTFISTLPTQPFLAAVVVITYFDLRVRKEGFDLELLARQIGEGGPDWSGTVESDRTGLRPPPPPPPPPPL